MEYILKEVCLILNIYLIEKYNIILYYKYSVFVRSVHNTIDCPLLLSKINFCIPRSSSRHVSLFCCTVGRRYYLNRAPQHNILCLRICNDFNYSYRFMDIYITFL